MNRAIVNKNNWSNSNTFVEYNENTNCSTIVLHVNAVIGAGMHLLADVISLPFFIRTRAYDVVIMLSFLSVISFTKLIQ